jgi:hypothetical protein
LSQRSVNIKLIALPELSFTILRIPEIMMRFFLFCATFGSACAVLLEAVGIRQDQCGANEADSAPSKARQPVGCTLPRLYPNGPIYWEKVRDDLAALADQNGIAPQLPARYKSWDELINTVAGPKSASQNEITTTVAAPYQPTPDRHNRGWPTGPRRASVDIIASSSPRSQGRSLIHARPGPDIDKPTEKIQGTPQHKQTIANKNKGRCVKKAKPIGPHLETVHEDHELVSSSVMYMLKSPAPRNAAEQKKNTIVLCFLFGVVFVAFLFSLKISLEVPSGNHGYLMSKEEKYNAKLPKFTANIIAKSSKFTTKIIAKFFKQSLNFLINK